MPGREFMKPSYLKLYKSGELEKRAERLNAILESCTLCPHKCRVDRIKGEGGKCGAVAVSLVSSSGPHFGEEAPLVGEFGSGTIFFAHCNLGCIFCQNYDISHLDKGTEVNAPDLSAIMLNLQRLGCHNINLVTPTHFIPQIVEALSIAAGRGLEIPIVYNCGGYESLDTLELLDGIIDIYMPDAKFFDDKSASEFTNADDYPKYVKSALIEMQRQTGDLKINSRGIAERGLLIRHLVMPGMAKDSKNILKFISEKISSKAYVNVMGQYRPCFRAEDYRELNRSPEQKEIDEVLNYARILGLTGGI